ncbi:MAG: hypothetical protein U0929_15560 [Planctomycetaceae bacterium]
MYPISNVVLEMNSVITAITENTTLHFAPENAVNHHMKHLNFRGGRIRKVFG